MSANARRDATVQTAATQLVAALRQHARVLSRNDPAAFEVVQAEQRLAQALDMYRSTVMARTGWTVPFSTTTPDPEFYEDVPEERGAGPGQGENGAQTVHVEAHYDLRVIDPPGAFRLAQKRQRVTGRGGCEDDDPYDLTAIVYSLFNSDGWDPFGYDDPSISVFKPWTLDVTEGDTRPD
jgi:hypothetical protein